MFCARLLNIKNCKKISFYFSSVIPCSFPGVRWRANTWKRASASREVLWSNPWLFRLGKILSSLFSTARFMLSLVYSEKPLFFKIYLMGSILQNLLLARILGSLSKPRRRRERERHETKGLMSKTIAVHVRYNFLYISLPSSAKQQREMTKFCTVYGTWTTTANFSHFHLKLCAVVAYLTWASF